MHCQVLCLLITLCCVATYEYETAIIPDFDSRENDHEDYNDYDVVNDGSEIFDVFEGQQFLMKLKKNDSSMTACNILNKKTNEEAQLIPQDDSSIPGVSYWGGGWDSHECGVRISEKVSGVWVLSAVRDNYTIDQQLMILRAKKVPHSDGETSNVTSKVGEKDKSFSIASDIAKTYCTVQHPSGDKEFTVYGKDCSVPIAEVSDYDNGMWTSSVGVKGLIRDLDYKLNVDVKEEKIEAGWRNSSSQLGAVELYCSLKDSEQKERAEYCHFVRPNDHVGFLLSDGLGNGKYSYSGIGVSKSACSMTIETVEPQDIGVWQCIIGYKSSYKAAVISFNPNEMHSYRYALQAPTSQVIHVARGSDLSLRCSAPLPLHYCFMVAPDGSQYAGDKTWLSMGTCVAVVKAVNDTHAGAWTCQMGPARGGKELSSKINVIVTSTSMVAVETSVTAAVGGRAILRCQSLPGDRGPDTSSLSYCRFRHPGGISVTFNDLPNSLTGQRFRYYGTGLQDGECGMLIDPVSVQDSGDWICSGVAGANTRESSANVTLQITDSTEVFPGSVMVEPGEEVILQMKGRREDQESCSVQMPDGQVVDLKYRGKNPVSYSGEGIKEGDCGVKIKVESPKSPPHGYEMWTLISNNSHSVSTRAVAWIGVKGSNRRRIHEGASRKIVAELGQSVVVDCREEGSVYCLIVPPGGNPDHYNPGPCNVVIDSLSTVDLGVWTCFVGLPTTTHEQVDTVELLAKDTSLQTKVTTTMLSLELSCSVPYPLKYCRFVDPSGGSWMVSDGLVSDRLSFKGRGLAQGECGLKISSINELDYGVWMCLAAVVKGNNLEHQIGYINIEKAQGKQVLTKTNTTKEMKVVVGSKLTVECQMSASLAYCWLLHPNGTQIVPVFDSETDLQMGICSLTLQQAEMEDSGRWVCHMGTAGSSGKEFEEQIDVDVKSSALYSVESSVQAEETNSTNIMCYTVPAGAELEYCRFLRPDGKGFFLNEHMQDAVMDRYQYYGEGLTKGQCGMTIERASSKDYGLWMCAAVLHGYTDEASSFFSIKEEESESSDNLVWIIPSAVAGVVLAVVSIATIYFLRRRRQARPRAVANRPTSPRVSDTSSDSSTSEFSRDQVAPFTVEPAELIQL